MYNKKNINKKYNLITEKYILLVFYNLKLSDGHLSLSILAFKVESFHTRVKIKYKLYFNTYLFFEGE